MLLSIISREVTNKTTAFDRLFLPYYYFLYFLCIIQLIVIRLEIKAIHYFIWSLLSPTANAQVVIYIYIAEKALEERHANNVKTLKIGLATLCTAGVSVNIESNDRTRSQLTNV